MIIVEQALNIQVIDNPHVVGKEFNLDGVRQLCVVR